MYSSVCCSSGRRRPLETVELSNFVEDKKQSPKGKNVLLSKIGIRFIVIMEYKIIC